VCIADLRRIIPLVYAMMVEAIGQAFA